MQVRNGRGAERPYHRQQMGHATTNPETVAQVPHREPQRDEETLLTLGGSPGVDGNGIGFIQVNPTLSRKGSLQWLVGFRKIQISPGAAAA